MKKILITGGAGFIGSHLGDFLVERGFKVFCVDNLITGNKKNIGHLLKNKNFEFKKLDITNGKVDLSVDCIFHLASPASPVDYQKYPKETAVVNSLGTTRMLELAARRKARFLLASTSEVYGDPKEHPQRETYWGNVNPFGPRSCYDEAKRFAEALTYIYLDKYKVDARIVRIFNTYGPRMQKDDGRVISNFINQALEGRPLTVYGEGIQTRSFCFVSDMVEGIYRAMFVKGIKGEVFNLGNPEEYKILDLAEKIRKMTNSESEIIFRSLPKDDPKQRRPDITKAKKFLSWWPKVKVEQGLLRTIEYYKSL